MSLVSALHAGTDFLLDAGGGHGGEVIVEGDECDGLVNLQFLFLELCVNRFSTNDFHHLLILPVGRGNTYPGGYASGRRILIDGDEDGAFSVFRLPPTVEVEFRGGHRRCVSGVKANVGKILQRILHSHSRNRHAIGQDKKEKHPCIYITKMFHSLIINYFQSGRYWIRTSDPLLVRQVLCSYI